MTIINKFQDLPELGFGKALLVGVVGCFFARFFEAYIHVVTKGTTFEQYLANTPWIIAWILLLSFILTFILYSVKGEVWNHILVVFVPTTYYVVKDLFNVFFVHHNWNNLLFYSIPEGFLIGLPIGFMLYWIVGLWGEK